MVRKFIGERETITGMLFHKETMSHIHCVCLLMQLTNISTDSKWQLNSLLDWPPTHIHAQQVISTWSVCFYAIWWNVEETGGSCVCCMWNFTLSFSQHDEITGRVKCYQSSTNRSGCCTWNSANTLTVHTDSASLSLPSILPTVWLRRRTPLLLILVRRHLQWNDEHKHAHIEVNWHPAPSGALKGG